MTTVLVGWQRAARLPSSPSDDSRVFAAIGLAAACPRAPEEELDGESAGVTAIAMDPDSGHHGSAPRLKRSGTGTSSGGGGGSGAGTPGGGGGGLSPGAVSAVGAVAGAMPSNATSANNNNNGGSRSTGGPKLRHPARHFTFDFRDPDTMEDFRAQRLQRKFREKMGAKGAKYELVAGFHLEDGVIISYHAFRTRIHFELTERRRKILARYYRQGQQEVLLYVDRSEFEYYTPVCCYQPPAQATEARAAGAAGTGKRQGRGGLAASCFAISGCAS